MKRGQEVEINLKPVMSIRINTRNHPCNVTNTHSVTQSVNDFISEKIGCHLPWSKNRQRNQIKDCHRNILRFYFISEYFTRLCDTVMDKNNFVDTMNNLNTSHLWDFGCFDYNCETVQWDIAKTSLSTENEEDEENVSRLSFMFQKSTPITVLKSSMAYGFSNFVADFGGYLGLLLGASLLSIYDTSIAFIARASKRK